MGWRRTETEGVTKACRNVSKKNVKYDIVENAVEFYARGHGKCKKDSSKGGVLAVPYWSVILSLHLWPCGTQDILFDTLFSLFSIYFNFYLKYVSLRSHDTSTDCPCSNSHSAQ